MGHVRAGCWGTTLLYSSHGYEAWLCWFRSPLGDEPYPSRGVTYSVLQSVVLVSPPEIYRQRLRRHASSGVRAVHFAFSADLVFRR